MVYCKITLAYLVSELRGVVFCVHACMLSEWWRAKLGRTPLYLSCIGGHVHLIDYLVTRFKADPDQGNKVSTRNLTGVRTRAFVPGLEASHVQFAPV